MDCFRRAPLPLFLAALVAVTACTRPPVAVPPVDYAEASHDGESRYRVRTVDGVSRDVTRFSVTDSTITIYEMRPAPDMRYQYPANEVETEIATTLPLDAVESIERLRGATVATQIAANTTAFVVVVAVIASVTFGIVFRDGFSGD